MFTGIIQDVGKVAKLERRAKGARIGIETRLDLSKVAEGDSVAVNGCCLTALSISAHKAGGRFEADMSQETLDRTSLGQLAIGAPVNLEPALCVGDPLGGHIVQGHVDAVATLVSKKTVGESWDLTFELPASLMGTVIEKGSIALDGVSLTIAKLNDPARQVTIAVIPHTAVKTTLLGLEVGRRVNVETDIVGKYVLRGLGRSLGNPEAGGVTLELLKKHGFAK